jgi:hypothetical protein
MTPDATTYVDLFTMNFRAIRSLCRDLTEAEARRRPEGRQNPVVWLAGHVTTYRGELAKLLGADGTRAAELRTSFGKDVVAEESTWPDLAEVLDRLSETHERIITRIGALGAAAFDPVASTPAGTRMPALVFLHFHECYHLGQLGYVRTWLGKSPLVAPGPRHV